MDDDDELNRLLEEFGIEPLPDDSGSDDALPPRWDYLDWRNE